MTKKTDLAKDFMLKNPKITENRTLAKMLYSKYEAIFKDIDDARYVIRGVQNKIGKDKRYSINEPFLERLKKLREEYPVELAEPLDTEPYQLPKKFKKPLIISDLHGGYCDMEALDMALEYGYKHGADSVIINGDLADFGTISKFLSKPNTQRLIDEIDVNRNLLMYIKNALGLKTILHEGNHDVRLEHHIIRKAPELWGLSEITFKELLKCKDNNIDYIENHKYMNIGKLAVTHGNHVVKGIFAPVNSARGVFIKTFSSVLIGHVHKTSEHLETDLHGKVIGCYSTGCLTTVKPEYSPQVSRYNQGFAVVEIVADDGSFEVYNKKIINGRVV